MTLVVEELYKIDILACFCCIVLFLFHVGAVFFFLVIVMRYEFNKSGLNTEGMKFPVMDYSWFESSIGHRMYEISSSGLFIK